MQVVVSRAATADAWANSSGSTNGFFSPPDLASDPCVSFIAQNSRSPSGTTT
jgi:hypothetical protein